MAPVQSCGGRFKEMKCLRLHKQAVFKIKYFAFLKCYSAVSKKCYCSLYGISSWSRLVKNVSLMTFLMLHTSCTNEMMMMMNE